MNALILFEGLSSAELTGWQLFQVIFLFVLMAAIIVGLGVFVGIKAFKSDKKNSRK